MPFRARLACGSLLPALLFTAGGVALGAPGDDIAVICAVGPEGRGNAEAGAAVRSLSSAGAEAIPVILNAMDGANDYALNWLRSAIEGIQQRQAAAGHKLPYALLEGFLKDRKHEPRARRLAYELMAREDAGNAQRLLPGFLNDPSPEMRSAAVDQIVEEGDKAASANKAAAAAAYRRALESAREPAQIEAIVGKLTAVGEKADLPKVFGWVTQWKVVGPFDNVGGVGFDKPFTPEADVDLGATYDGKSGKVQWRDYETKDDYGWVNFNQPFTALKGVAGYAYAEFWCDQAQTVQIRLGSENSWKAWANGKFLFGHDEYHRNHDIDQYRLPVEFKPGRNVILVKCLQNEQTEDWAGDWRFQLRVTDAEGTPLHSTR